MYLDEHRAAGVKIHTQRRLAKVNVDAKNNMESIVLDDGTVLEADMVIMATGVYPATMMLENSGIELNSAGAIVVDPFLQTSAPDVFAAGDLAEFPYWPTGGQVRVDHWAAALDQGTYAAFNMMGKMIPYA